MTPESRDELEASRARFARVATNAERDRDKLYTKLRALENAIRKVVIVGERVDMDALYRLRQRVPNKPRPTVKERRKGVRR